MNNNPLKQYFRRPAIYIRLPSRGVMYNKDIIDMPENGEIPVFPMTAIDEISSRTPDALFNGQAMADIIQSCLPCIKQPWLINAIDFDTILLAIKIATTGEKTSINGQCPSCKNDNSFEVDLVNLLNSQSSNRFDQPLVLKDLTIKFRPLTYSEVNKNSMLQYDLQKMFLAISQIEDSEEKVKQQTEIIKKINQALNDIVATTIKSIKTPETEVTEPDFIKDFIENCDLKTNKIIKEYSADIKSDTELKPFKLKCIHCGHNYEQGLNINISNFFG